MGWEADNINTGGTDGYEGGFVNQQIVTAGKLKLARAAAQAGVRIAELKYQSQRITLVTQVRSQYYAVLVALERIRVFKAMDDFAKLTYTTQIEQVKGGVAAPYEPLLLRVAAVQARAALPGRARLRRRLAAVGGHALLPEHETQAAWPAASTARSPGSSTMPSSPSRFA